jgi:hypothetical protein
VRFRDTESLISDRERVVRTAMVVEIRETEANVILQQRLDLPEPNVSSPGGDILQSQPDAPSIHSILNMIPQIVSNRKQ